MEMFEKLEELEPNPLSSGGSARIGSRMDEGNMRIGVLICDCDGVISDALDMNEVVDYVKGIEGVVYVREDEHFCLRSEEERGDIKEELVEKKVNRVVIAACPHTGYEHLFNKMCHDAGISPYLVKKVNIREQCALVHRGDRSGATEKAKDMIRMGVLDAKLLERLVITSPKVDDYRCIRCLSCLAMCPSCAIDLRGEEMKVDEFLCRECGICEGICPVYAIKMPVSRKEKLLLQIRNSFGR